MVHATGLTPNFDDAVIPRKLRKLSPVQFPIVVPCFVQACCNGNTIFVYVHISTYVCIGKDFPSAVEREGWGCSKWVKLFVIQQLLATAGASGHNKLMSCPLNHTTALQSLLWSPFTHCVVNGRTQWQPPLLHREPQLAASQAYHHWKTNNKLQFIWIQQLVCQECSSKQSKNL